MKVVYEDNHIIIVYKESGEIVQGDKTGDVPLSEAVKAYLKEKYQKPGNVFLGVVHRLDRPVCGLVVFARTGKALSRLNEMFRNGEVQKTYWAITREAPALPTGRLTHWLVRNEKHRSRDHPRRDQQAPGHPRAIGRQAVIVAGQRQDVGLHLGEARLGGAHLARCPA